MTLPKPDKLAVGQWWDDSGEPWQLTSSDIDCTYLLTHPTIAYLGCGENPEPSEWMIETLARHIHDIEKLVIRDYSTLAKWGQDEYKETARYILGGGECEGGTIISLTRSVLSLYRILRELGKW